MGGFGRNEAVDSGGFRGIIPDNTTVPVIIIDGDASLMQMKKGDNAGRTARIYKPVMEVLIGKYKGGRIYGDVWCNVEPDPSGGEPIVFGSHMTFCDMCDSSDVHEDDGSYPTAATEKDAKSIANKFVGKMMLVTVGVAEFKKKDQSTGQKNTIKTIISMVDEQKNELVKPASMAMERYAKQRAKKRASAGGSGFDDDDDDTPF